MNKQAIFLVLLCSCILPRLSSAQSSVRMSGEMKLISATLSDASGKPAPGVMTYLSVTAPRRAMRAARTDANGVARFLIPELADKGQIVFQVNNLLDSNLVFTTGADFVQRQNSPGTPLDYSYPDTSMFYGAPDKEYILDEYTRFATLEEVFREFIPEVRLSKQGNDFRLAVQNKPYKVFFDNEPLVLMDGIPIFDANRLLELDPLKIRSIDVVSRKYYLGSLLCYGIISIFSFDGDLAGYTLPRRALVKDFTATGY